jgi:chemotaxis protein MotA
VPLHLAALPAFGMVGTLIGLIQMLHELDDPVNIGAGMAVALVTTFYGGPVS